MSEEAVIAMPIKPRQPAPALELRTVEGRSWSLDKAAPKTFTMVVAYRSLHCPICRTYLGELETKLPEFGKRGVEVIAVSVDTAERAARAKSEWGLHNLRIGYGLPVATARNWGLFISRGTKDSEPPEFTEPGIFLVKPDGTLFAMAIASFAWARPPLDGMLRSIDYFIEHNPPARGAE